jgi:hypothetical protein
MPIYEWVNDETKQTVEVLREFSDYKVPPTADEVGISEDEHDPSKWTKVISSGIRVTRGDNWRGKKGSW